MHLICGNYATYRVLKRKDVRAVFNHMLPIAGKRTVIVGSQTKYIIILSLSMCFSPLQHETGFFRMENSGSTYYEGGSDKKGERYSFLTMIRNACLRHGDVIDCRWRTLVQTWLLRPVRQGKSISRRTSHTCDICRHLNRQRLSSRTASSPHDPEGVVVAYFENL